jgi:phage tail tape-measure protein
VAAGAAGGGAAGAAAGAVMGPAGAVVGAAVGAYVGSLPGALDSMRQKTARSGTQDATSAPRIREAGMMLAIATPDVDSERKAEEVLRRAGATEIEQNTGEIRNGDWVDFDPLAPPGAVVRA